MDRRNVIVSFVALVIGAAALGQEPPPEERGAKELFFDPASGSVTRVSAETETENSEASASQEQKPATARSRGPHRTGTHSPAAETQAAPLPDPVRIGLSSWIELDSGSGGPGIRVAQTRIFRSGERIRLHFRSNVDGYISLIQLGTSGSAQLLFPDVEVGLVDNRLGAFVDRVLPSIDHWFRFDETPGAERLLVLFARSREELGTFPVRRSMEPAQTASLFSATRQITGSKDLRIETEVQAATKIGTYGVNVAGKPVILEIVLQHR
jgi:hypothetical protein